MSSNLVPDSFDDMPQERDPEPADVAAVRLFQQLQHPFAPQIGEWNLTLLRSACRTIAGNPDGSIQRMYTVLRCPENPRGVLPVVEYAESLADHHGLRVHCTLTDGTITVTFERRERRE